MTYVIAKDFYESRTGSFSLRQFWSDERSKWGPFDQATQYPEPMEIHGDKDPHESSVEVR